MDAARRHPPPRTVAPGEDSHLSLALINTAFPRPSGPFDELSDAGAARAWLVGRDLLAPEVACGEPESARLCALREALRALFEALIEEAAPGAEALESVNAALAQAPGVRTVHWTDGVGLVVAERRPGADPVAAALSRLAEDGVDLLSGGEAGKLARCGARGCVRLFLRSHAARRWCSDRCGNRVRAARHYAGRGGDR
ncbi:CGNR zinc finger domain-containing protein [Streptomyces sp. NPDC014733]|uniref:CGNR zinc finger domain-containing protein n=1 Tax=Streptomyces sp. NPDC014733 TaxID=3364885 RepID=UPI003700D4FD